MRFTTLQSLQRVLLVNWVAWIGLGLWILANAGFASALGFVILWLVLDRVWDFVTTILIASAGKAAVNEQEAIAMQASGTVPALMGAAMLLDLVGTLLLPWLLAALFLGWFGA